MERTRTPAGLADDRRSILHTMVVGARAKQGPGAEPGARYDLVGEIGAGGMGSVYRAHDHDLGRDVALKALRPELTGEREYVARFLREAQATGQLEHPNIVPLHDLGISGDGTPWFTMKLVRGESLEGLIRSLQSGDPEVHRRFSFARRLALVQEVCDALEYAHSQGVLHRDLKPSNVMLGPYGEVLVLDWGIAKRLAEQLPAGEEASTPAPPSVPGVTAAGGFVGTLGFAAPEQVRGEPLDGRADVYAVGALMYELLALTPPFPDTNFSDLVTRVLEEDPPPADTELHPAQGRVPREVARVIERALARDPQARFQSARELRDAIQAYLDGASEVVCVSTGMKRAVHVVARLIDNHPVGMALLAVLGVLLPIVEGILLVLLW